jgi:hypothetical protein
MDRSGEKHPLGLREGATENTAACKASLLPRTARTGAMRRSVSNTTHEGTKEPVLVCSADARLAELHPVSERVADKFDR